MKKTIFALIIGVVAVMLASSVLAQINSREMQNLDKTAKIFLEYIKQFK